jgi:hypothetical protein
MKLPDGHDDGRENVARKTMLAGSDSSGQLNIDLGVLIAGQTESLMNPPCPLILGIGLRK